MSTCQSSESFKLTTIVIKKLIERVELKKMSMCVDVKGMYLSSHK
jgi:hypothetical protein